MPGSQTEPSFYFRSSSYGKNTAEGAYFWMRDAQGNVLQLARDGQRNLQEILTPQTR